MKMKERICYLLLCLPCFLIRAHDFVLTNIRTGEETTFSDALDEKKAGGAIDQGEMRRTERFNKVLRTERNKIKSNNRFGSSSLSNANQAKAADNDDDNEDRYIIKFTDDVSFQRHARRLKSNGAMSTPIMTLEEEHIQVMSLSSPEEIAEWEIQDGVKYVEKGEIKQAQSMLHIFQPPINHDLLMDIIYAALHYFRSQSFLATEYARNRNDTVWDISSQSARCER